MEYLIFIPVFAEPVLIAGYLSHLSYQRIKSGGKRFTFSMLDILIVMAVIAFLLWKSVKAILRYPDHRYDMDFSPLSLPLVWIGALSGMFIGRCYCIRRDMNDSRSAARIVLWGALGIGGIFIAFIPWAMLWMRLGGG